MFGRDLRPALFGRDLRPALFGRDLRPALFGTCIVYFIIIIILEWHFNLIANLIFKILIYVFLITLKLK